MTLEAEKALRMYIGHLPWDDIAFQRPSGMYRMYHFRGQAMG